MKIWIRPYQNTDTVSVLEIHRAAVHQTAAPYYPVEILEDWSPVVDEARIEKFTHNTASVRLVAESDGKVVGFGEVVVSSGILGTCYVHPDYGRRGIGESLLSRLEEAAKEQGLNGLFMDASVNAEAFYRKHGYEVLAYSEHTLRSGRKMACVKMRKDFL